jgi:hypothetical protein
VAKCIATLCKEIDFTAKRLECSFRCFSRPINTNLERQIRGDAFVSVHLHPVTLAGEVRPPELQSR